MDGIGIALVALFMYCLTLFAILFMVGGVVKIFVSIKNKKPRIIFSVTFLLCCGLIIYRGSALIPEEWWLNLLSSYQIGDNELKPYEHAIAGFDRESMGFSSISQDSNIKIIQHPRQYTISCPGVKLYIDNLPIKRHYICLRKTENVYTWDSEYEEYLGPNEWESIWLAYSSRPNTLRFFDIEHKIEPYKLVIEYWGSNDVLIGKTFTLESIRPILKEWEEYHKKQSRRK